MLCLENKEFATGCFTLWIWFVSSFSSVWSMVRIASYHLYLLMRRKACLNNTLYLQNMCNYSYTTFDKHEPNPSVICCNYRKYKDLPFQYKYVFNLIFISFKFPSFKKVVDVKWNVSDIAIVPPCYYSYSANYFSKYSPLMTELLVIAVSVQTKY